AWRRGQGISRIERRCTSFRRGFYRLVPRAIRRQQIPQIRRVSRQPADRRDRQDLQAGLKGGGLSPVPFNRREQLERVGTTSGFEMHYLKIGLILIATGFYAGACVATQGT